MFVETVMELDMVRAGTSYQKVLEVFWSVVFCRDFAITTKMPTTNVSVSLPFRRFFYSGSSLAPLYLRLLYKKRGCDENFKENVEFSAWNFRSIQAYFKHVNLDNEAIEISVLYQTNFNHMNLNNEAFRLNEM